MIVFIDRAKKLLHQIDVSLIEEEYDLVEINAQVLLNLLKENQNEALEHKIFLENKLLYLDKITSRFKEQTQEMLKLLNSLPCNEQ